MIGEKILLVDDEAVFTENMAKLLTNRDYRVTAVNSGDAAIKALEEEDIQAEIHKVVESPISAFSVFGRGKRKK